MEVMVRSRPLAGIYTSFGQSASSMLHYVGKRVRDICCKKLVYEQLAKDELGKEIENILPVNN